MIGSPGIDIVIPELGEGHNWLPADGEVSLSLNWFNPASISQAALVTEPGQSYEVSFWMAAEIFRAAVAHDGRDLERRPPRLASVRVHGPGAGEHGLDAVHLPRGGTGSDTLAFLSTTPANFGPALDNVSVTAVPVPGTLALMSAGLVALRRRRSVAT
ncbi:MAG: PEP-CTERM sorting domain-containing protein [Planctomycetia bacterium]|nr:PEP-CTERM sorting domain-containing protein [Planctomycetia bacterium]